MVDRAPRGLQRKSRACRGRLSLGLKSKAGGRVAKKTKGGRESSVCIEISTSAWLISKLQTAEV